MRNCATVVAVAATFIAAAGCGSDANAPPATVIDFPGYTVEVTDGSLALNASDTFGQQVTGTLSGRTLTVDYEGTTIVFRR